MFFLRTMQAPVVVTWGQKLLTIPKFTLDDAVVWGSEIQNQRDEKATEGMEDAQRREFQAFYPSIPPDINELRKLMRSIEGIKRVIRICLMKAKVSTVPDKDNTSRPLPKLTEGEIASILSEGGSNRLGSLAFYLSDVQDDVSVDPNPPAAVEAVASPSSEKPALKESPATGPTT